MASIQVNTNGQTLKINASVSHWTTAALAVAASGTNDVESTTTTTVSSDYTMHFSNSATTAVITVTQPDGTTLLAQTFNVEPSTGPRVLNPVPDQFQNAADAAGTPPPGAFGRFRSGYYYWCTGSGATSAAVLAAGYAFATPWVVTERVSLQKIGCEVSSAGGAGCVVRIGVWADTGGGYPGALVLDCGTIDGTSATVQDITLASALVLGPALYWVGTATQVGTAATIRTAAPNVNPVSFTAGLSKPSANTSVGAYTEASVTGAFTASFGATVAVAPTTQAPRIHFQVS
jgi:hypothetical protein